jgi:DHA3 family macrolide efflux protein-like MFS transporter
VLIAGVALGLIAGFLAGGSFANLVDNTRRLRWLAILVLGAIVRFGTEIALNAGVPAAEAFRLPLFAGAFGLLLLGCWANRREAGFSLAFVGIASNLVPVLVNGGFMPIWMPSLLAAGFTRADVTSHFHTILPATVNTDFLLRAGPLGDVIPIPLPLIQNVASIGDVFLAGGLAFFGFASVVRGRAERDEWSREADAAEAAPESAAGETGPTGGPDTSLAGLTGTARLPRTVDAAMRGLGVRAETGLAPGLAEASVLERPLVLGGGAPGLASPALAPLSGEFDALQADRSARASAAAVARRAAPRRHHPYIRLALNGSFSALWVGQLISLFGDRIHQVALAFLVLGATHSPLPVALVFLAATLPNLILSPVAGTFVDRWSHKDVMVVSDLLRAAVVLLIPIAAATNLALVYPLVFVLTTISLFFRPARTAIIPRIVAQDELLTANSATWLSDTMADIVGYPLAGLFVAFLGSALPLAFWVDAGTYVASAVLIASMAVPSVLRRRGRSARAPDFLRELREGWHFLRGETVLLANTLQGAVAQFTVGVLLALTPIYASEVIQRGTLDAPTAYGFLETSIGVGNLVGGVAIGLVGARLAKGRLVIVGYTVWGICTAALAVAGQLPLAMGLMVGSGIANMVYIIPSQTLFQERTPADLIGRVVGFRFSLVFGSMTLAMGLAGLLAIVIGTAPVIGIFGITTTLAGLAGLLIPAVRDA